MPAQQELAGFTDWSRFIGPVILQLEKDFQTSGLPWDESIAVAADYPELYRRLLPCIENLLERHFESLFQLLYRIDIPESFLKRSAQVFPEKTFPQQVTELIIMRELHKVILQQHYSK